MRHFWFKIASESECMFLIVWVDTCYSECLERNKKRPPKNCVPLMSMEKICQKFEGTFHVFFMLAISMQYRHTEGGAISNTILFENYTIFSKFKKSFGKSEIYRTKNSKKKFLVFLICVLICLNFAYSF